MTPAPFLVANGRMYMLRVANLITCLRDRARVALARLVAVQLGYAAQAAL
jgi:hypothetical protein